MIDRLELFEMYQPKTDEVFVIKKGAKFFSGTMDSHPKWVDEIRYAKIFQSWSGVKGNLNQIGSDDAGIYVIKLVEKNKVV